MTLSNRNAHFLSFVPLDHFAVNNGIPVTLDRGETWIIRLSQDIVGRDVHARRIDLHFFSLFQTCLVEQYRFVHEQAMKFELQTRGKKWPGIQRTRLRWNAVVSGDGMVSQWSFIQIIIDWTTFKMPAGTWTIVLINNDYQWFHPLHRCTNMYSIIAFHFQWYLERSYIANRDIPIQLFRKVLSLQSEKQEYRDVDLPMQVPKLRKNEFCTRTDHSH